MVADIRVPIHQPGETGGCTSAEVSEAGVAVHYTVSWEAFHACDGKTFGGDQSRVVRGQLDGKAWTFEKAASPSIRSTLDEF